MTSADKLQRLIDVCEHHEREGVNFTVRRELRRLAAGARRMLDDAGPSPATAEDQRTQSQGGDAP